MVVVVMEVVMASRKSTEHAWSGVIGTPGCRRRHHLSGAVTNSRAVFLCCKQDLGSRASPHLPGPVSSAQKQ
jgi:hypothetical protein